MFRHSHDHEHTDEYEVSLRQYIDFPRVTCLNEDTEGSAKQLLEHKSYEKRFDHSNSSLKILSQEDGDQDLLITVPFTEAVSITSICISGPLAGNDSTAGPKKVKIFSNRDDIGFSEAQDLEPSQEFYLASPDHEHDVHHENASADYPLRPAGRFQNVTSLVLYFPEPNYSDDDDIQTEILYIGFKGKGTNVRRKAVDTVYETIGMVENRDVRAEMGGRNLI